MDDSGATQALLRQQQETIRELQQQLCQKELLDKQAQGFLQEQQRQLQQIQTTCQELRSRLKRQQQQTLQFKAALEQCIDAQGSEQAANDAEAQTCAPSPLTAALHKVAQPGLPEQPIQPWSAQAVQTANLEPFYPSQSTDKLTALSAQPTARRETQPQRRPLSSLSQVDLPTFPRYQGVSSD